MTTLKEILELTWTVTELSLDVREPDTEKLIQHYEIGEKQNEENATAYQLHEIQQGRLTMIDANINYYGRLVGNKVEMGWGSDFKQIPAELLEMEVTHFSQRGRGNWPGTQLTAHLRAGEKQMELNI